jgi:hypothetical protein
MPDIKATLVAGPALGRPRRDARSAVARSGEDT